MKPKWSHVFMFQGMFIGVVAPPAVLIDNFIWYSPLIAIALGFLGLAIFYISFSRPFSFDENQDIKYKTPNTSKGNNHD